MSEKKKIETGGPAFPTLTVVADVALSEGGLTVRDYFAAKAMQAYFSDPNFAFGSQTAIVTGAKTAYIIADAMISAREEDAE